MNDEQLREMYATMIDLKNRFNKINTSVDNLLNSLNENFIVDSEGIYSKKIKEAKRKSNEVKSDIVVKDIPNIEELIENITI